jgi:hypothetical protein
MELSFSVWPPAYNRKVTSHARNPVHAKTKKPLIVTSVRVMGLNLAGASAVLLRERRTEFI